MNDRPGMRRFIRSPWPPPRIRYRLPESRCWSCGRPSVEQRFALLFTDLYWCTRCEVGWKDPPATTSPLAELLTEGGA